MQVVQQCHRARRSLSRVPPPNPRTYDAITPHFFSAATRSPIVWAVDPVVPVNVDPDTTVVPEPAVNPLVIAAAAYCVTGAALQNPSF